MFNVCLTAETVSSLRVRSRPVIFLTVLPAPNIMTYSEHCTVYFKKGREGSREECRTCSAEALENKAALSPPRLPPHFPLSPCSLISVSVISAI